MGQIINPDQDQAVYTGIADLVGITSTPAEIDASPLFLAAENFILAQYPTAKNRTDSKRSIVLSALQFCAAYYMLSGGGKTATKGETVAGGAIRSRSQSLGPITLREDYSTSGETSVRVQGVDDRIKFFQEQCGAFLTQLGVTPPSTFGLEFAIELTENKAY